MSASNSKPFLFTPEHNNAPLPQKPTLAPITHQSVCGDGGGGRRQAPRVSAGGAHWHGRTKSCARNSARVSHTLLRTNIISVYVYGALIRLLLRQCNYHYHCYYYYYHQHNYYYWNYHYYHAAPTKSSHSPQAKGWLWRVEVDVEEVIDTRGFRGRLLRLLLLPVSGSEGSTYDNYNLVLVYIYIGY